MVFTWFSAGRLHNQLDTLIEGQEEVKTALTDGFENTNTSLDEIKTALTDALAEINTTLQEIDGKLGSRSPLAP